MKERPILFSGPMVRAILAGQKTQTRRVMRFDAEGADMVRLDRWTPTMTSGPRCPYGVPGDRLWVRETFAPNYFEDGRAAFRADWSGAAADVVAVPLWSPSIFMPRGVSRISLEITSVRVERLHDITEADIAAEGVSLEAVRALIGKRGHVGSAVPPRVLWELGWMSINGVASWNANPWVWALSFDRIGGAS